MRELYHNLNIPFLPLNDMTLYDNIHITRINISNINTILMDKLNSVGLYLPGGLMFYSKPFTVLPLAHIDGIPHHTNEDWPSRCKLNFVIGTADTSWFDVPLEHRKVSNISFTPVNSMYQPFNVSDCIRIHSEILNGWHLFESGVPHSISNNTSIPRWCISMPLRFKNSIHMLPFNECKARISTIDFNN